MSLTLIILLGLPAGVALAMALSLAAEWVVSQVEAAVARGQNHIEGWPADAALRSLHAEAQISHQQDHAQFLQWAQSRRGVGRMSGGVDETVIEAQQQIELIRFLLDRELPRAARQCCGTHRAMAEIDGAWTMADIQYEPECLALRARSAWLMLHTSELLESYPFRFDDPRLLHNSLVLRKRAVQNCSNCPYIELPVDRLTELCATAALFRIQPEGANDAAC